LKRFLFKILVIAYDWNYNFKYSNNKGLFWEEIEFFQP
jgi:hypothetical protein